MKNSGSLRSGTLLKTIIIIKEMILSGRLGHVSSHDDSICPCADNGTTRRRSDTHKFTPSRKVKMMPIKGLVKDSFGSLYCMMQETKKCDFKQCAERCHFPGPGRGGGSKKVGHFLRRGGNILDNISPSGAECRGAARHGAFKMYVFICTRHQRCGQNYSNWPLLLLLLPRALLVIILMPGEQDTF